MAVFNDLKYVYVFGHGGKYTSLPNFRPSYVAHTFGEITSMNADFRLCGTSVGCRAAGRVASRRRDKTRPARRPARSLHADGYGMLRQQVQRLRESQRGRFAESSRNLSPTAFGKAHIDGLGVE